MQKATPRLRCALTALSVVGVLLPPAEARAQQLDPAEQLEDVESRLEEAERGLADIESRQGVTLGDLERRRRQAGGARGRAAHS